MENQKKGEHEVDLPAGLAQPALRALSAAGIGRLDQFTTITEADLLKLHGIGPNAINRSALRSPNEGYPLPSRMKAEPPRRKSSTARQAG